jgi:hypothetical protein
MLGDHPPQRARSGAKLEELLTRRHEERRGQALDKTILRSHPRWSPSGLTRTWRDARQPLDSARGHPAAAITFLQGAFDATTTRAGHKAENYPSMLSALPCSNPGRTTSTKLYALLAYLLQNEATMSGPLHVVECKLTLHPKNLTRSRRPRIVHQFYSIDVS